MGATVKSALTENTLLCWKREERAVVGSAPGSQPPGCGSCEACWALRTRSERAGGFGKGGSPRLHPPLLLCAACTASITSGLRLGRGCSGLTDQSPETQLWKLSVSLFRGTK